MWVLSARYALWCVWQRQQSSTSACLRRVAVWCPICGSFPSVPSPHERSVLSVDDQLPLPLPFGLHQTEVLLWHLQPCEGRPRHPAYCLSNGGHIFFTTLGKRLHLGYGSWQEDSGCCSEAGHVKCGQSESNVDSLLLSLYTSLINVPSINRFRSYK